MNGPLSSSSRPSVWIRRVATASLLLLTLLPAPASAAPRIGTHEGYTRLVFNLPKTAQHSVTVAGQSVTVRLPLTLKAEQGALSAPGVTAYAVAGGTVTVIFARGYGRAKASVLPAASGQPARLIVDVLTDPASRVAATAAPATASAAAARIPARPVTRQASTAALQRPRVVLDPGHGGRDPGMVSRWLNEEDVTLDVALRTRAELVKHGVDVVMTRASDRHLSTSKGRDLDLRSQMASTGTVSAFVSIHVNAASASAQGIETYYFGKPLGGSNRSLAVAENGGGSVGEELTRRAANTAQSLLGDILSQAKLTFSRDLARRVQSSLVSSTGAVNRGVQTDAFYVIRNPTTPAILVELGFGSHPVEGPKLATSAYRERLAQGLARAILDFLNTD